MRAIVVTRFGESDVLEEQDVPPPRPGPGEVLIAVRYAAVNFADVKMRRGQHYRAPQPPYVPGMEVAGTVTEVGDGVIDVPIGAPAVARTFRGGYAQFAVARADQTFPLAEDIGDDMLSVMAGAPTVMATALLLLDDVGRLRAGESVLVHGAAGGLGLVAGQLAARGGASLVLGTVGHAGKADVARRCGYTDVFPRDTFEEGVRAATSGRGVDLVLDPIGGTVRARSLEVLAPLGRLVAYGDVANDADVSLSGLELRQRNIGLLGLSLEGVLQHDPVRARGVVQEALDLVLQGEVTFPELHLLPLERAVEAHRLLEDGSGVGKFVLEVPA